MGRLSTNVKSATARLSGFYVDDIKGVSVGFFRLVVFLDFSFKFDDFQTSSTNPGRNSGHVSRNLLFRKATEANPVKTISQINLDVSGCEKFWPAGMKGSLEMEHTADELR